MVKGFVQYNRLITQSTAKIVCPRQKMGSKLGLRDVLFLGMMHYYYQ